MISYKHGLLGVVGLSLLCACQPAPTSSAPASAAPSTTAPAPDATTATAPDATAPDATPAPDATSSPTLASAGWQLGYARRDLTPGVRNPAVTQATISVTICKSGWTATVRPPASYTNGLKASGLAAYGYANRDFSSVEEDHLLPLEGGGSPTDPRNLWPQPRYGAVTAAQKDAAENVLRTSICSGAKTLAAAQDAFLAQWTR